MYGPLSQSKDVFQSAPASLRRENQVIDAVVPSSNKFQSAPASLRRENLTQAQATLGRSGFNPLPPL